MKNLYLFTFLCFFSTSLLAQWESLGDDIIPRNYRVWSLKVASDNSMWAVSTRDAFPIPAGESPRVHVSSDEGITWNTFIVDNVPGIDVWDISAIDKNTAYITTLGGILKTENGGENWTFFDGLPDAEQGYYTHFWNENEGFFMWANSDRGILSLTDDGGKNWTEINLLDTLPRSPGTSFPITGDSTDLFGIQWYSTISEYSVRGDMMIMATRNGRYYLSKDKGYNWTLHETPFINSPRAITTIAFFDENTIMVSSDYDFETRRNGRTITHATNDGGLTWTQGFPEPVSGALHRVPGTQQSFILNGHNNFSWGQFGTFVTHDLGATWERLDFTRTLAVFINDDDIGIGACCNNTWFGAEGQIFKWQNPLSDIDKNPEQLRVALSPNPTADFLNISMKNPLLLRGATVEIFDVSGRMVHTKRLFDSTGKIDVQRLSPGFYSFSLKTEEGIFISKFIKK